MVKGIQQKKPEEIFWSGRGIINRSDPQIQEQIKLRTQMAERLGMTSENQILLLDEAITRTYLLKNNKEFSSLFKEGSELLTELVVLTYYHFGSVHGDMVAKDLLNGIDVSNEKSYAEQFIEGSPRAEMYTRFIDRKAHLLNWVKNYTGSKLESTPQIQEPPQTEEISLEEIIAKIPTPKLVERNIEEEIIEFPILPIPKVEEQTEKSSTEPRARMHEGIVVTGKKQKGPEIISREIETPNLDNMPVTEEPEYVNAKENFPIYEPSKREERRFERAERIKAREEQQRLAEQKKQNLSTDQNLDAIPENAGYATGSVQKIIDEVDEVAKQAEKLTEDQQTQIITETPDIQKEELTQQQQHLLQIVGSLGLEDVEAWLADGTNKIHELNQELESINDASKRSRLINKIQDILREQWNVASAAGLSVSKYDAQIDYYDLYLKYGFEPMELTKAKKIVEDTENEIEIKNDLKTKSQATYDELSISNSSGIGNNPKSEERNEYIDNLKELGRLEKEIKKYEEEIEELKENQKYQQALIVIENNERAVK